MYKSVHGSGHMLATPMLPGRFSETLVARVAVEDRRRTPWSRCASWLYDGVPTPNDALGSLFPWGLSSSVISSPVGEALVPVDVTTAIAGRDNPALPSDAQRWSPLWSYRAPR